MSVRPSTLPLLVSYILFPIVSILARNLGLDVSKEWIEFAWILLSFFSLITITLRGITNSPRKYWLHWVGAIVVFIAVIKFVSSSFQDVAYIPYLMEIKPVVYFFMAMLWIMAFRGVNLESFVNYGAWLGVIILVDFLLESFMVGHLVRARGSGEPIMMHFCY